MNIEAEVSIKGMKHSDFNLLEEIIRDYQEKGYHSGRKDYHDKSLLRLQSWIFAVNVIIKDSNIQEYQK